MNFIQEKLVSILKKRAVKFVKENLKEISNEKMCISTGYQNHMCHWNSYNEFLINPDKYDVVATICTTNNEKGAFVHFINKNKDNGNYVDFTLGTSGMVYYTQYEVGVCDLGYENIEDMGDRLLELKYWLIDRCFKNKYIISYYKKLEDKYTII